MTTLEEDLHVVLDWLHKLAFSSLTPANIQQLRDATECIADIRDASSLAQELVWILEDNPQIDRFTVQLTSTGVLIENLEPSYEGESEKEIRSILQDRMARAVKLCNDPKRVAGWSLVADRECLTPHLEAPCFDAASVLSLVAPQWAQQLIIRIDQATSHHHLVHDSRQQMRAQPAA